MPEENHIIHLPQFHVLNVLDKVPLVLCVCYAGDNYCPRCGKDRLRIKDSFYRSVRHESMGTRTCYLKIKTHKFLCLSCRRYFNQRLPGILPGKRSTESFRKEVFEKHRAGICQSLLSRQLRVGAATIERWTQDYLKRLVAEKVNNPCPRVLGIDEHFFSRKKGYATTLCDLTKHRVYDVTLGRSEKALRKYLRRLEGRQQVEVVLMDLAQSYRQIVRKYFPNAQIVADRFHVIRLVNQYFLKAWQQFDPVGRKNRGLLSLMRRHGDNLKDEQRRTLKKYFQEYPVIGIIYETKEKLCELMRIKRRESVESSSQGS